MNETLQNLLDHKQANDRLKILGHENTLLKERVGKLKEDKARLLRACRSMISVEDKYELLTIGYSAGELADAILRVREAIAKAEGE